MSHDYSQSPYSVLQVPISEAIKGRLQKQGIPYFANDHIGKYISEEERKELQKEVEYKVLELLRSLVIDVENDHNTRETAKRVAKMYMQEIFSGRYNDRPRITTFPNVKKLDELYTTGPITVRSACSHHMVPIIGKCWIGIIPKDTFFGLSKFNRIVEWICARPQIQEEMTVQIANEIEQELNPVGLAVVVDANHMCMTWRGVKEDDNATMTTSVMRGKMLSVPAARAEFFALINKWR